MLARTVRFKFLAAVTAFGLSLMFPSRGPAAVIWSASVNPVNAHTYFVVGSNSGLGITWTEAEAAAIELGGHLATVNDQLENDWITQTFQQGPSRPLLYLWIGLNDAAQEGEFTWANGEEVDFTNWYVGEPDDLDEHEDFVHIYNFQNGYGQWNDLGDESTFPLPGGPFPMYGVVEIDRPPLEGDVNFDGIVNARDLALVRDRYGISAGEALGVIGEAWPMDGTVDLNDLNLVRNHLVTTQLPEPNSLLLTLATICGAAGVRRWRRRIARRRRVEFLERRDLLALTPSLVADLNTDSIGAYPGSFAEFNGRLFFAANDGVEPGLYSANQDLTEVTLVKSFFPRNGSEPVSNLVVHDGTLYFNGSDLEHGNELWRTDGTTAGTVMVKDIARGPRGSEPAELVSLDGALYFIANDAKHGFELWRSDGTSAGTKLVIDLNPGDVDGVGSVVVLGDQLLLQGDNGVTDFELWSSDGTAGGTKLIKDIYPGNRSELGLDRSVILGDHLYFDARDGDQSRQLWRTDGTTAGTVRVTNFGPAQSNSEFRNLTAFDNAVYFATGLSTANSKLWRTSAAPLGAELLRDSAFGTGGEFGDAMSVFQDHLFFASYDPARGVELWKISSGNGSPTLAQDLTPGAPGSLPGYFTVAGEKLYFLTFPTDNRELWVLNDAQGPAERLATFDNGTPDPFNRLGMISFHNALAFTGGPSSNIELWKSDGTAAGTVNVAETNPITRGSDLRVFTAVGEYLYFLQGANELWRSDGTPAGTLLLRRFPQQSNVKELAAFQDQLYFVADDGEHGYELWKSGGTVATTQLVQDIFPGQYAASPSQLTVAGDQLFFRAYEPLHGEELYKTDGINVELVRDIVPGSATPALSQLTAVGAQVYFTAETPIFGRDLWTSDGTTGGTHLVREIVTGSGYPSISQLTAVGGALYFAGLSDANGYGLWKSDGTFEGTQFLMQVSARDLHDLQGTLLFRGTDDEHGSELWRSDGTAEGTYLVKDINVGPEGTAWSESTSLGNVMYFAPNRSTMGTELWRTDGTNAGTYLVKDIRPGLGYGGVPASSRPEFLTAAGDRLFFAADDWFHGRELWTSDGTNAGTVLEADLFPGLRFGTGLQHSHPMEIVRAGRTLFLIADDGRHGRELWKLEGPAGDANFDGAVNLNDLNAVRNHFGEVGENGLGDADGNGHIDLVDLNLVRNNFGATSAASSETFNRSSSRIADGLDPSVVDALFTNAIEPRRQSVLLKRHQLRLSAQHHGAASLRQDSMNAKQDCHARLRVLGPAC